MDKNLLYELYINQKLSSKNIAFQLKVSYSTVLNYLKKFNIPIRNSDEHIQEALKKYIGLRYGKLIIKSRVKNSVDNMSKWECLCDCGNIKIVRLRNLKNGECKSCGCLKLTRYGKINGSYFWRVKSGAKHRNLSFNITIKDAWKQFEKQFGKCALSGEPINLEINYKNYKNQTASLDRIDSSKGYELDNIQWIHKDLQSMKMNMNEKEFFKWIEIIYKYKNHEDIKNF